MFKDGIPNSFPTSEVERLVYLADELTLTLLNTRIAEGLNEVVTEVGELCQRIDGALQLLSESEHSAQQKISEAEKRATEAEKLATQVQNLHQALQEKEKMTEAILDSCSTGIIVVDEQQEIVTANKRATDLLEEKLEPGTRLTHLSSPTARRLAFWVSELLKANISSKKTQLRAQRKNGDSLTLIISFLRRRERPLQILEMMDATQIDRTQHQLTNLLHPVLGFAELMRSFMVGFSRQAETLRQYLEPIAKEDKNYPPLSSEEARRILLLFSQPTIQDALEATELILHNAQTMESMVSQALCFTQEDSPQTERDNI